jgi:anti-sigma factor (TIGR02949 family)
MTDNCGPLKGECAEVLQDLYVFLDGECADDLEASVRHHLGDCPPCMDRADFERALRELIASKCRDAAPTGLVDRIIDGLRAAAPGEGG